MVIVAGFVVVCGSDILEVEEVVSSSSVVQVIFVVVKF